MVADGNTSHFALFTAGGGTGGSVTSSSKEKSG